MDRIVRCAGSTDNWRDLDLGIPVALHNPFDLLARVHHHALDLALAVSREVRVGYVLEMALDSLLVIYNVHVAALVNPQLSYDYVVHRCRDLAPRVVMLATIKL